MRTRVALAVAVAVTVLAHAGCDGGESPSHWVGRDDNVVVITVCGMRPDRLEVACASGRAPRLAKLRETASFAGTIDSASNDCLEAHEALFRPWPDRTLPEHLLSAGYDTAAFVSRSELYLKAEPPPRGRLGFARFELPPIERFSIELFGENAAPVRLRRDAEATARAAVEWLARARSPFFLWVELDALAIESASPPAPEQLAEAALERIAAVDRAVNTLLDELARGGRDRRTLLVFTADHGEALGEPGEEECFGHRVALPAVTRVPLCLVDPAKERFPEKPAIEHSRGVSRWLAWRLGLASTAEVPPNERPNDSSPPSIPSTTKPSSGPFLVERGELPLADSEARALLPELRALVAGAAPGAGAGSDFDLDLAEHYLAALFALEERTKEEQAELDAARARWLEAIAFGPGRHPFAATVFARGDLNPGSSAERRREAAEKAARDAPWYFPAARVLASAQQVFEPVLALRELERFGREAPLAPAARLEFERLLEDTRKRVMKSPIPGVRPPR